TGEDIDIGTDDVKYVTPKAIADSSIGTGGGSDLTPATGEDIDIGTDDVKYVTAKSITDSSVNKGWDLALASQIGTTSNESLIVSAARLTDSPYYRMFPGSFVTVVQDIEPGPEENQVYFSIVMTNATPG